MTPNRWTRMATFAVIAAAASGNLLPVAGALAVSSTAAVVTVAEDLGGEIIRYLLRAAEYRESHTSLRFDGRCDSACTLFLGLPSEQICVTPEAYFRFHRPIADDPATAQEASQILMMKYPDWVKAWIDGRSGLTEELLTMDYAYARQFVKPCESTTANGGSS